MRKLGQRAVVARRIADHARQAVGAPDLIGSGRQRVRLRRVGADAGMVVVEREDAAVVRIPLAGYAHVARAEITAWVVVDARRARVPDRLPLPRAAVAMRRDHDPLSTKWMPALVPDHRARVRAAEIT